MPPEVKQPLAASVDGRWRSSVVEISVAGAGKTHLGLPATLDRQRSIEVGTRQSPPGLRPQTALARRAGLTINRGVCVDSYLQTSNAIFTRGDCAEINGRVLPGLQPIQLSAMVLAKNLLGQ
ncbi:FAD-dependent oxidoreductase [Escherichia coli]